MEKNEEKQRVRIKSWKPVAMWNWDMKDEHVCQICNAEFEVAAPGVKYPGDDSPIVLGVCGHAFHIQCIEKWVHQPSSNGTCPICRQHFDFQYK